jgi:Zyg-11 family protein
VCVCVQLFEYERIVRLLLSIVRVDQQDEFIQRIGIFLLNSLACQVEEHEKVTVGNLGAIEVMCEIIRKRLNRGVCDEVMEVAWSLMWNITGQ